MSVKETAIATAKIVDPEREMALARIVAGLAVGFTPPEPRKYVLPFETDALEADLQAAEAAGKRDEFSLLDCIYLPNGKKLGDSTGDEVARYVTLERLVTAQRVISKQIDAELARLATQVVA